MNHDTDPFEALDRLARVADSRPVGDPMPGITRRARANRRRAIALAAGGVAAAVAAGFGVVSAVDLPGSARAPEFAGPAPASPTPAPDVTPTPDAPEPSPDEVWVEYDRAEADVDGDGSLDTVRVMIPETDAAAGLDSILESDDTRLEVEPDTGGIVDLEFSEVIVPKISGTRDLDGDGTAEIVLSFSGGDSARLRVFTFHGGAVVSAVPADDAPAELVDDGFLLIEGGVNAALTESGLISWAATEEVPPHRVRLWTWQLDGTRLVPSESDQAHCMSPDRYAEPGGYPEPC